MVWARIPSRLVTEYYIWNIQIPFTSEDVKSANGSGYHVVMCIT